ncbi:MAG: lipopolysaccharide exporter [Cognaticolwellia sp.]|jgi:lipopolysaccharide exporter
MGSLRKGSLASLLLVFQEAALKAVGLVSTLVLARILLPEDFGIIALAMLFLGLIQILAQTGSAQYLLRVDKLDDDIINTSWTINFILTSILAVPMIASGFLAAHYYDDPRLINIILTFTFLHFISNWGNPGLAYLRRAQEYTSIVKLSIITKVITVIVVIITALTLQNYWALVVGRAVGTFSGLIGSYFIYSYRPKFQLTNAKEQWKFSGWVIPQSIFGYVRTQLDSFLVSSSFGLAGLGSYNTIKYISYMPNAYLLLPITQTFLVELVKAKGSKNYFNKQYNASFILIMLIAAPITSIMYLHHELVTLLILGPNWLEYSYLMSFFSLLIPAAVMLRQASRVLLVYGKTKQIFFYECIAFVFVYTPLLIIGIDDLRLFSAVRVMAEIIVTFVFLVVVALKYTGIKNTASLVFSLVPMALGIFIAVLVTNMVGKLNINVFVDLSVITFVFICVFALVVLVFHMLVLRNLADWKYLEGIIFRIIAPVVDKLKLKG